MQCIYENEPDELKSLEILKNDLNFLVSFSAMPLDKQISPLILASALGRSDAVKFLLSSPTIDLDLASEDSGLTPLAGACAAGNYEVLKLLLQKDAEVNKPSVNSRTPFVFCFQRLNEENMSYENKKICFKMVELLIESGADLNWIVDKTKGYTLLMELCATNFDSLSEKQKQLRFEAIKFLVEKGANKEIMSLDNMTCFDLAKKSTCSEELLEILNNTASPPKEALARKKLQRIVRVHLDMQKLQKELDTARISTYSGAS